MIQRIQSIWLLLASITIILLLVLPVATSMEGSKEFWIQGTGLFQQEQGVVTKVEIFRPLAISIVAVAVMCIAIIFSFKKRSLQKKLCFAAIAMILSLSFWVFNYTQKIPGGFNNVTWNAGIALPVLAMIFCALAIRGITKDEQLLRSADRLR
jgi:lipopolysaccharide export LptBFGC system permease protein LptF